ncbi:hypothetical protein [[Haemophilus] ducreyi]|uniref:Uncharacterized protein n=2 Tax=Haemophilus ducreyi TaxID=730 RepID=Q7VPD9_HAEDU|nr:hypothetical protein [[Haemophilus] ducreyi]AAP95142.1 hypothetical protein HD_0147 [[Haemophilus] ducreyi 35000HP]
MADITAFKARKGQSGALKDTGYLDGLTTYRGADKRILAPPRKLLAGELTNGIQADLTQPTRAHIARNYYVDLYSRIYVIPHIVNLGSISTEQTFSVQV